MNSNKEFSAAGVTNLGRMPELPEVEITARRLDAALRGAAVESALAPGMVALKSVKPPLEALAGPRSPPSRRVGEDAGDRASRARPERLALLIHMMSAGRLQLFDKRASLRDKRSRILIRIEGRPRAAAARVRHQAAGLGQADGDRRLARGGDGRDARPGGLAGAERRGAGRDRSTSRAICIRCSATSGRSPGSAAPGWTRSSGEARLSPFKKGSELTAAELERAARGARCARRRDRRTTRRPSSARSPTRCRCRCRSTGVEGEPCPRCGTEIAAIHYCDHITCYCPAEQNDGKLFADRRLSRLLK